LAVGSHFRRKLPLELSFVLKPRHEDKRTGIYSRRKQQRNVSERDEVEQSWADTWTIFSDVNQRWDHFIKRKERLCKLRSCKHWHETVGIACDTINSARIKVILTTNVNPPDVRICFDNTRTGCLYGMWPVECAAKAQETFICLRNTVICRAHNYGAASYLSTCIFISALPPPFQFCFCNGRNYLLLYAHIFLNDRQMKTYPTEAVNLELHVLRIARSN